MVAPDGDVTLTINAEGACLALETRAGCVEKEESSVRGVFYGLS
ncbi:hypothetical protein EMGR_003905 [Emarellia grisea]